VRRREKKKGKEGRKCGHLPFPNIVLTASFNGPRPRKKERVGKKKKGGEKGMPLARSNHRFRHLPYGSVDRGRMRGREKKLRVKKKGGKKRRRCAHPARRKRAGFNLRLRRCRAFQCAIEGRVKKEAKEREKKGKEKKTSPPRGRGSRHERRPRATRSSIFCADTVL